MARENGGVVGRLPYMLEMVTHELDRLHDKLDLLVPREQRQLVIGGRGAKSDNAKLSDGSTRFVVRGTGNGGQAVIPAATAVLLVGEDIGRIAGSVATMGLATVVLYLQDLQSYQAGLPAVQIPLSSIAGGASTAWDMRLSHKTYVGGIVASNIGAGNATIVWGTA